MAAPKLIDTTYEGPQKIDRYDLVAEIASGGMATVFLAQLAGVGGFRRFVAIKRLHPHLVGEEEFVQMFLDEARLAAGIHHPNVVPILEVGASDRGYYLVMEYIEGDTLARLLARAATSGNRLPARIGIRIALDMLAGLHAAHELRDDQDQPTELVHRDVSPQNVLVGVDGNTRITDFGVARAASRLSATRAGQLKGKIAYMAPEQATGDPHVDRRADVFSSAIVLWEVLAARRLFKAENEAATLSRVISEPIADICEVNPELDPSIGQVVMKALERDRDHRYVSCADFAEELERAAVAAGEIAVSRDVAAYVSDVIGNEIAQQREAVRSWLARSEPSQARPETTERGSLPGEAPHRSSEAGPDHSGMVAAPVAAPLGEPQVETGGRSKTPLVIAVAALMGFAGVGAAVTLLRSGETVTEGKAAGPTQAEGPAGGEATTSQGSEPGGSTGDETDSTQQAKSSGSRAQGAAGATDAGGGQAAAPPEEGARADDGEETETPEPARAPRPRQRTVSRARPRRAPEPKPAPKPAKKPEPEPEDQGGGSDIDLSNPYR